MSKRGKILPLTRAQVLERAFRNMTAIPTPPPGAPPDAGGRPINYRLEGGYNGGDDPEAEFCCDWSYGRRTPTADCIGFALHSAGIDRLQPGYNGSRGEWLNCAALWDDAHGEARFVRKISFGVQPGDFILSRSHIGIVLRPETKYADELVIDCSPRHERNGQAINTGKAWSEECIYARPTWYTEDSE